MRRIVMVLLAGGTALAVPTTVVALSGAVPASAASSLTCPKLKVAAGGVVTISKCAVPSADKKIDKKLTGNVGALESGGTLTWTPSNQTIVIGAPGITTLNPAGICPNKAGEAAFLATGPVTGGTSTVTSTTDTYSATVCLSAKGKISLAKGTGGITF